MARNPDRSKAKPVTVRIDADLLAKVVAIGDAAPYKPTLTQLMEAALSEYVEKHSPDAKRKGK